MKINNVTRHSKDNEETLYTLGVSSATQDNVTDVLDILEKSVNGVDYRCKRGLAWFYFSSESDAKSAKTILEGYNW